MLAPLDLAVDGTRGQGLGPCAVGATLGPRCRTERRHEARIAGHRDLVAWHVGELDRLQSAVGGLARIRTARLACKVNAKSEKFIILHLAAVIKTVRGVAGTAGTHRWARGGTSAPSPCTQ